MIKRQKRGNKNIFFGLKLGINLFIEDNTGERQNRPQNKDIFRRFK